MRLQRPGTRTAPPDVLWISSRRVGACRRAHGACACSGDAGTVRAGESSGEQKSASSGGCLCLLTRADPVVATTLLTGVRCGWGRRHSPAMGS